MSRCSVAIPLYRASSIIRATPPQPAASRMKVAREKGGTGGRLGEEKKASPGIDGRNETSTTIAAHFPPAEAPAFFLVLYVRMHAYPIGTLPWFCLFLDARLQSTDAPGAQNTRRSPRDGRCLRVTPYFLLSPPTDGASAYQNWR